MKNPYYITARWEEQTQEYVVQDEQGNRWGSFPCAGMNRCELFVHMKIIDAGLRAMTAELRRQMRLAEAAE